MPPSKTTTRFTYVSSDDELCTLVFDHDLREERLRELEYDRQEERGLDRARGIDE